MSLVVILCALMSAWTILSLLAGERQRRVQQIEAAERIAARKRAIAAAAAEAPIVVK